MKIASGAEWEFICVACSAPLRHTDVSAPDSPPGAEEVQLPCTSCGAVYPRRRGIWDFLRESRRPVFERFLADYVKIRLAEGRGSEDPEHYRSLPDCPAHHPSAAEWRIRGRTFAALLRRVLPELGPQLKILDLGAGTGWLSYRLQQRQHSPCSIDVNTDDRDGLVAARHYSPTWPRIRAEFDCLPLPRGFVDLVVFNASLHYSAGYRTTLAEALRVLKPDGRLVVLETPVYRSALSGRQMAEERHAAFEKRFGTRSDTLPSREFLTWERIGRLAEELGLRWSAVHPGYGVKWALRPWLARLRGRREPAQFPILVGRRT